MVPLQPLQVTVFSPSSDKDKFENTAWTVNGKIGNLKAIYTGGYLVRNLDQRNDYTSYARTLTEGGDVLGQIAKTHQLTAAQRATYGGTGPMTPEAGFAATALCGKVPAPAR